MSRPTALTPQARLRMIRLIPGNACLGTMNLVNLLASAARHRREPARKPLFSSRPDRPLLESRRRGALQSAASSKIKTEGATALLPMPSTPGLRCAVTAPGRIKTVLRKASKVRDIYRLPPIVTYSFAASTSAHSLEDIFLSDGE